MSDTGYGSGNESSGYGSGGYGNNSNPFTTNRFDNPLIENVNQVNPIDTAFAETAANANPSGKKYAQSQPHQYGATNPQNQFEL